MFKKKSFVLFLLAILIFFNLSCSTMKFSLTQKYFNLTEQINVKIENQRLSINSSNDEIVSFSLNESFLIGFQKSYQYKYHMASIDIKEKIDKTYRYQKITELKNEDNYLLIEGAISDGKDFENNINYSLKIIPVNNNRVDIEIFFDKKELNCLELIFNSTKEEKIFGGGVQFSYLNLKGQKVPIITSEQGAGRGDQPITFGANLTQKAGGNKFTTYFPIPFFFTSNLRAFHFDNSSYQIFDFTESNSIKNQIALNTEEKKVYASFFKAESYKSLISLFTEKVGRMSPLPDWSYGTILGIQGGKEKVNLVVDRLLKEGNPIKAIWIQDWCGKRVTSFGDQLNWRWYADEKSYPDFKNFVKQMNEKGVRVLGYINPFLADKDNKKIDDDFINPLLDEAKSRGYLVKNKDNKPYLIQTVGFPAYLLDLTNPEAVEWIKNIIKENLIGSGLSGWMADFGEWLPMDAILYSGISAEEFHNLYPVVWAKINREAIKEAGKEGEIVFFARAGFSQSTRYSTLFWLGDQMVSFGLNDGLASAILGSITASISGIPLIHSDIGGYTTITNPIMTYHRSKELLLRWIEFEAFTPIFRTHEGNQPLNNWQVYQYEKDQIKIKSDEETTNFYNYFAKIHYSLAPYFKLFIDIASKTGIPVIRPLFLNYPEDKITYDIKYQFMIGDDLLVAPVIKEKKNKIKVYLPKGRWLNLFSKEIYDGKKYIEVEAPLGKPAVFMLIDGENYQLLQKIFFN